MPTDPIPPRPRLAGEHFCETCNDYVSGSHYHCGRCNDPKPTSMLGHATTICRKQPGAAFGSSPNHVCCPDGYCALAEEPAPSTNPTTAPLMSTDFPGLPFGRGDTITIIDEPATPPASTGHDTSDLAAVTADLAAAIRAATWRDIDACDADEEECFDHHPIHVGGVVDGQIILVYARVDGLAETLAPAVRAAVDAGRAPLLAENERLQRQLDDANKTILAFLDGGGVWAVEYRHRTGPWAPYGDWSDDPPQPGPNSECRGNGCEQRRVWRAVPEPIQVAASTKDGGGG